MSRRTGLTRLEVERRARGLTQRDLAELAGLLSAAVGRLERSQTGYAYAVMRVAAALDRPVEALFDRDGRARPWEDRS